MRQRGSNKNNFNKYQTQNQWRSRHHAAAAYSSTYQGGKNWDDETSFDYYHEDRSQRTPTTNYADRYNDEEREHYEGQDLPAAHHDTRGQYESRPDRHPSNSFLTSSR